MGAVGSGGVTDFVYTTNSVAAGVAAVINAGQGVVADLFDPRWELFSDGEQGLWYDLNDLSTIFQDSAGTTPATWGDPVGLALDKSGRGNNATQGTSGARPILGRMPKRGRVNLLGRTQEFDNAYWTQQAVTVTANATTAPDGTTTADRIIETTSSNTHIIFPTAPVTTGLPYTQSIYIKKGVGATAPNIVALTFRSGGHAPCAAYFNINTGVLGSVTAGGSATITSVGDGWYRCTLTATSNATTANGGGYFAFSNNTDTGSATLPIYAGSVTSDVYLWGAQFEQSATATGYQAVLDSLGFNITESGQPSCGYLSFNGSNQWMQTAAAVNFSATDEMSVFAGVRKNQDVTTGMVLEVSTNSGTNNGAVSLAMPTGLAANSFNYSSIGTVGSSNALANSLISPVNAVITGLSDISADTNTSRKNGALVQTVTTDQGTGNYGNYVTYFGARAGTSLFFNGLLFSVIIRGVLTSSTLLTKTEQYVYDRTPTIPLIPVASIAPVISGTTEVGETLTSTTGTWSAFGAITYAYQWMRGTDPVGTNSSTYVLTDDDVGFNMTCTVTATTVYGSSSATSNSLGPVTAVPDDTWLLATGGVYGSPPTSGSTTLTPFRIYEQEGNTITRLTDPSNQVNSGAWRRLKFSADTLYVAGVKTDPSSGEPKFIVYSRSGSTFTKLADPATPPAGATYGLDVSNDGTYFAVGSQNSPYIQNYKRSGSTLTKLANPASLPGWTILTTAFSSDATYLAVGGTTSVFKIYKRSGDTFTDLSQPTSPTSAQTNGLAFSADDTYLYRATGGGVISIEIYKRSGDTFTKLTAPASMSTEISNAVACSPDGKFVALALGASDRLWVYERSGDTFTKLPNLAYRPSNGQNIQGLSFSPNSDYLAVAINASPYIVLYSISGSTFTRVTPSGLPTTEQYSVAFSEVLP